MNKKEMVKVLAKIARENNYVKSDMLNAVYDGLTIEESAFIASAIEYMFDPKAHSYKFDGKEYKGGTIYDTANGKTYNCSMKQEGNVLKVRGSLDKKGLFGRTMDWFKVK